RRVTSTPSKRIFPFLESIDPATPRMVVLLPAPLAPIRVTISPSATSKDTSRTAGTSPYASSRFVTSSSKFASEVGLDHARIRLHLARRALEDAHAVVHDEHALRHVHHQVHVVLDDEDGHISLIDVLQSFEKKLDLRGVEAGGGFVEHEEPRPRGERAGDLEHALLAIGKRTRAVVRPIGQAHEGKKLERVGPEAGARAGKKTLPQRQ